MTKGDNEDQKEKNAKKEKDDKVITAHKGTSEKLISKNM